MDGEKRIALLESYKDKEGMYPCMNERCLFREPAGIQDSNIEVHHIIEQEQFKLDPDLPAKLGYEMDDPINLIPLCTICHRRYHNGVIVLRINGKDYQATVPEKVNWKALMKERKQIRKENRQHWGLRLTGEQVVILLYWLYVLSFQNKASVT